MKRIYFDNNATTPLDKEVKEAIIGALDLYGNPSSHHELGQEVRRKIEEARENVAKFINADKEEIIFTSGGSESNNIVLKSIICKTVACGINRNKGNGRIITSAVEHPSVIETCKALECGKIQTDYLPVDENGLASASSLRRLLKKPADIVSIMYANNETGVVMPIKEMAEAAHEQGALFHTDAVQAAGKIPIDVKDLGVDFLSISGHKMYAPKGIGILYIKKGVKICPLISGGHQETGMRAGTENTLGIIAIGKAALISMRDAASELPRIKLMRDRLEKNILERIPYSYVNGDREKRVPNTLNISFDMIEGESILYMLDHVGIEVSTGSACSSGSLEPSPVLQAMGLSVERMHSSIRISLGKENTDEEIDYASEELPKIITKLRNMSPFKK